MDAWIREILTGSPILSASALPTPIDLETVPSIAAAPTPSAAPLIEQMDVVHDWQAEEEMQRLLDLLPVVQPDESIGVDDRSVDVRTALGLELCGEWNFARETPLMSSGVGVF